MKAITKGYDPESCRSLVLYVLNAAEDSPLDFESESQFFIAMLVCDGNRISDKEMTKLSRKLIDAGCAYLCCWGRNCERVHDMFDAEWIDNGFDSESSDTILTTWHSGDSLDEFIQYVVWFAGPTEKYRTQTKSVVAIVIDDLVSASRIREAFSNPTAFFGECNSDG